MLISNKKNRLYIVLISVHGLVRGKDLELGRDADTGGQTRYVIELARALSQSPDVERVDLLTRQVVDPKISPDYSVPEEPIERKARIIRIQCGPKRYLRKEVLWPYLDTFSDRTLAHFRKIKRLPDIIHSHYADAGYVGSRLSAILGIPLVFTGHSLGRVKLKRFLEQGVKKSAIEEAYHIGQRIEAEEMTLDYAGFEVASTNQEVEEQYKLYDNYEPETMVTIPPGVDLSQFGPPGEKWKPPAISAEIDKFLSNPNKPLIFAISRPDFRKNIKTLIKAYAHDEDLQKKANLLIIAGNRGNLKNMEKGPRDVLMDILLLIDEFDLYGKIAYPKKHKPEDVPEIYRLVYKRKGVFVNPALTEPFGLTLLEAAASGVPLVATEDGGPKDIIGYCRNGLLIDPLDKKNIAQAIQKVLSSRKNWLQWSKSGLEGVHNHFSWKSHVSRYLKEVKKAITKKVYNEIHIRKSLATRKSRIPVANRIIISDIDNTLIGDKKALEKLLKKLNNAKMSIGFGIATGRSLESTLEVLNEWGIDLPDVLITSVGTEIHYAPNLTPDISWTKHINYRWAPTEIKRIMKEIPGFKPQEKKTEQSLFKISYNIDNKRTPKIRELKKIFRNSGLHVNLISSLNAYLDIIPVRASKGSAIRRFALKWGIPFNNILVMGDSGNDEGMLRGDTLGVVVGNYSEELEKLKGKPQIYFAKGKYAQGIIEGIDHYNFLDEYIPRASGGESD